MKDDEIKMATEKYKICEVTPQNNDEDVFNIFADDVDRIKKWIIDNYDKENLPKVKYVYSTSSIEEVKKYGKQV